MLFRAIKNVRRMPTGILATACITLFTPTMAGAEVTQTLDSVDTYGTVSAIKMRFDDTRADRVAQGSDFFRTPVAAQSSRSFVACSRAPNRDMVCLENDAVVLWEDAEELILGGPAVTPRRTLFSCTDRALGLVTSGLPCTTLTTDTNGNIWLGGRTRGKTTHSVLKVIAIAPGGSCTLPFKPLEGNADVDPAGTFDYCAAEYATGRPVLEDIAYIGGDTGDLFVGPGGVKGPGLLMMEQKLAVSFIPDPATPPTVLPIVPRVIGETRTQWGLQGSGRNAEDLQSVSVLQRDVETPNGPGIANYVVVTTSTGRVLAKRADGLTPAFPVFTELTPANCPATPRYGVRTRYESNRVYVSDRACQRVVALETHTSIPEADPTCSMLGGDFFLCNARERNSINEFVDVTLTTNDGNAATIDVDPIGVIVSPGVGIDMNECTSNSSGFCIWEPDGNGNQIGARMSNVTLADRTKSGLTVYRILDIPDCRYEPHRPPSPLPTDLTTLTPTERLCAAANAIVTVPNPDAGIPGEPALLEMLNVSPLLPSVIQKLFNSTTTPSSLPPLLISPLYRAQAPNYTFEAYFGRTEEGVVFRGNFFLDIDVPDLTGTNVERCGGTTSGMPDFDWNVPLTVSERATTASVIGQSGTGTARKNIDMLTIVGCTNPNRVIGTRTSLWPYNMALEPVNLPQNPYGNAPADVDAYANLLYSLYQDLGLALTEFAGKPDDGGTPAPLSATSVNSLRQGFDNGQDKLKKCIEAAYDKRSAADQTCQAFDSQLNNFRSSVLAVPRQGTDPQNRIGELVARSDVIFYILYRHFLPSVPTSGFLNP